MSDLDTIDDAPTLESASALDLAELTTEVLAAYVTQNHVQMADLPGLIASVHGALSGLGQASEPAPAAPEKLTPPISIKKSITDDYLISLEDGKQYQSLKRHLATHGLTPHEYRAKWGLPTDYPMVAPTYARKRSELARNMGLGRKAVGAAED